VSVHRQPGLQDKNLEEIEGMKAEKDNEVEALKNQIGVRNILIYNMFLTPSS
jgi:hypothetical protein